MTLFLERIPVKRRMAIRARLYFLYCPLLRLEVQRFGGLDQCQGTEIEIVAGESICPKQRGLAENAFRNDVLC